MTLFNKLQRGATWKTKKDWFSTWDSFGRENWALQQTPVSSFNFFMQYCGVCTGNSSNEYAEGHYAVEAGGMPNGPTRVSSNGLKMAKLHERIGVILFVFLCLLFQDALDFQKRILELQKQREKYGIELSQAACDKIAKVCCFNCTSKQVDVGKRMQMVNEGICDTVSEILIAKIEWGWDPGTIMSTLKQRLQGQRQILCLQRRIEKSLGTQWNLWLFVAFRFCKKILTVSKPPYLDFGFC